MTLESTYPIQYYYFYEQRPCYDGVTSFDGQELALQSGLGLTYFFYAQFCQYHLADFDRARTFYRRFLTAEPHCLPDNRFRLFSRDATQRSYPPSTQEALTEIGNMHLQQQQATAARQAFEEAIALRPDNFQAPYERLAYLLLQQGQPADALSCLSRKSSCVSKFALRLWLAHNRHTHLFLLRPWPPGLPGSRCRPVSYSSSDFYARAEVHYVGELYKQLADTYFYELHNYRQAGPYYRKYLAYLASVERQPKPDPAWRKQKIDASESQIRLAMEQGD